MGHAGEDVRALLPFLDRLALVEISFPSFRDGRGYSAARILREAGYTGELRAVGDVLIAAKHQSFLDILALAQAWADQGRPAGAVLAEAGLSYVGLGAQPPTPSWGRMLAESQTMAAFAPWLAIFPGLAIVVTVLGLNLMGDGLRDALDPRLRRVRT